MVGAYVGPKGPVKVLRLLEDFVEFEGPNGPAVTPLEEMERFLECGYRAAAPQDDRVFICASKTQNCHRVVAHG